MCLHFYLELVFRFYSRSGEWTVCAKRFLWAKPHEVGIACLQSILEWKHDARYRSRILIVFPPDWLHWYGWFYCHLLLGIKWRDIFVHLLICRSGWWFEESRMRLLHLAWLRDTAPLETERGHSIEIRCVQIRAWQPSCCCISTAGYGSINRCWLACM